jgi:urease accessory protein
VSDRRPALGAAGILIAVPATAAAHDLSMRYGAFLGAAAHVLTEADHLAAFAAIGLLAGQHAGRPRTAALAAFALALLLGLAGPLAAPALRGLESVEGVFSAATLLLTGALVAGARPLPMWLVAAVGIAVGGVQGLANGLAIEDGARAAASLLGAASAALLIAAIGTAIAPITSTNAPARIAVRVVGSWVAAMGLLLLGLAVRG